MLEIQNKKTYFLAILLILIIAFVLRVFDLENNPRGFFADEAAIGYNAYSLLTSGKDEFGKPFPILFESFGDYRLPLPIYANIPVIAVFGLNEFSVRLTTVLFGLINILFTILFTGKLFGRKVGVITGLIMSVIPWHLHISRWGAEYIYFPAIISIAIYLYLKSLTRPLFFPLAMIFFGLSMYTYYSAFIVTPLLLIACLFHWLYSRKKKEWRIFLSGLLLLSIILLPIYFGLKNNTLLTRLYRIDDDVPVSLNQRAADSVKSFLEHFSFQFLFISGDIGYRDHFITRHSVTGFGQFYLFQFPLILIGLVELIRRRQRKGLLVILFLLFLYPLGNVVVVDSPSSTRPILGVMPFSILTALGLVKILILVDSIRIKIARRAVNFLILGILLFFIGQYYFTFLLAYPLYSADFWGWQYGPKKIMAYFLQERDKYDDLYLAPEFNGPEIFLKFYDPTGLCKNCHLGSINEFNPDRKQLFAGPPVEFSKFQKERFRIKKVIYYPNGMEAFFIFEKSEGLYSLKN